MSRWAGRFVVGEGYACYAGPTFATARHAHHALQVVVAAGRPVRVRAGDDVTWRRVRGIVVPPDVPHAYDGRGAHAVLLYLDPESPSGRVLGAAGPWPAGARAAAVPRALRTALHAVADAAAGPPAAFVARVQDAVAVIGRTAARHGAAPQLPDARVAVALRRLWCAGTARPTLATLARAASISPSRLTVLFRAETGIPMRRYLLWIRLRRAAEQIAAESCTNLSAAAHAAGFADAAHMTRTFRRMLGVAPSAVFGHGDSARAGREPVRRS